MEGTSTSAITKDHIASQDQPAYRKQVVMAIAKLGSANQVSNSVARPPNHI